MSQKFQNKLIIKELDLGEGIFLAPMAGVTDSPVRRLAKSYGADVVCSEMMAAKALAMVKRKVAKERVISYAIHQLDEKPFSAQLFGREPETFTKAAKMVLDAGADIIDINSGCPVKKVVNSGSGVMLMRDPALFGKIVAATRSAGDFPLTVKIRLGWDQDEMNFLEIAKIAVEEGADAIILHPRTRTQMFHGHSNWSAITQLVKAVDVPVIGNGDIKSGEDVIKMFTETGCAGVMIGRAANGNPWIFKQIKAALNGEKAPNCLSPMEVHDIFVKHFKMLVELKDENRALKEIRKHLLWYTRGMTGAVAMRRTLFTFTDQKKVLNVAEEFFKSAEKGSSDHAKAC